MRWVFHCQEIKSSNKATTGTMSQLMNRFVLSLVLTKILTLDLLQGITKVLGQFIFGYEEQEKHNTNIQEILNSQMKMEKQVMQTLFNKYLILIQQNNMSTLLLINALV